MPRGCCATTTLGATSKPCLESVVAFQRRLCRARISCLAYEPLRPRFAYPKATASQLLEHARGTLGALDVGVDRTDERQQSCASVCRCRSGLPPHSQARKPFRLTGSSAHTSAKGKGRRLDAD